jgi:hypothetical protein
MILKTLDTAGYQRQWHCSVNNNKPHVCFENRTCSIQGVVLAKGLSMKYACSEGEDLRILGRSLYFANT